MEDVLCRAYINLLEDVSSLTPQGIAFPFYRLWPMIEQINQPVWMPLLVKFYEKVTCASSPPSIFHSSTAGWVDLPHAAFLEPVVRSIKDIGSAAVDILASILSGRQVVEITKQVLES